MPSTPHLGFLGAKVLAPVRSEPRAWLANERTFLSWAHMSSLLAAVAIGLATKSSHPLRLAGMLLATPACLFVFYALRRYHVRLFELNDRSVGSDTGELRDDTRGPLALLLCFTLVNLLNLAYAIWRFAKSESDSYVFPAAAMERMR